MRLLMVVLVGLFLGCGERSMPVKPAGKSTTDCSMAEILAGTCSDTADPTLDEVPDGYVAPVDSTGHADADTTDTEAVDADTTATDTTDTEAVDADTTEAEIMPEAYRRHYISLEIDSVFTPEEYDLINQAADDWDRVISSGYRDGITISVEPLPEERQLEGLAGDARITGEGLVREGIVLPTLCRARLQSSDAFNSDWPLTLFKYFASHEIGHCLGIGSFSRFSALLEDTPGYEYRQFVGHHARVAFRKSAGSEWTGPNVPMINDAHWSPVLHRSPLTPGLTHYTPEVVTTVDAAALLDIGYRINMSEATPTRIVVGQRSIYGPADLFLGAEALLFPENT